MKRTDQQVCLEAIREARRILSEYIQPGPRDAVPTVDEIMKVLDNRAVEAALERVDGRNHFNVVEFEYFGPNGDPHGDAG
jgi:hypothetical protein